MRIIVFFDLPVLTAKDRTEYRHFRKALIKAGYMMMQESVYCKLVPNSTAAEVQINLLYKNKPEKGLVQVLKVTEKQFSKMECIAGEFKKDVIDSEDRIVFL